LNLSAEYTYDNDLLTSITTASTTYNFTYGDFALRDSIAVGNQILASYDYQEGTNWLERLDYGNEDYVQYTYDNQGRVTQQSYEDGAYVTYKYDNSGALAKVYDSQTGTTSTYYYDFTDRMMKYVEKSSTGTHSVGYEYDNINNLTALVETINGVERKTSYTYDGDNRPTSITAGNSVLNYSYDDFGRVSSLTTNHDGTPFATKTYTYKVNANGKPTNQVSSVTISDAEGHPYYTYTYTYDQNGNITGISDGTYTTSYAYDSANQLIREDNQEAGTTTVWTYDNAGNILTRTVYPYTTGSISEGTQTNYYYTDTQWGDLLTAYNNKPITRDEIGNPTNDFVWRYTWQHGRQLASMTKLDGSAQWNYTYNADGLRTQRIKTVTDPDTGETISDRIYNYTYNGDKLTHMTVDGHTMYFTYDASGVPLTMVYDGNKFYYVTNLQGDVISIINGNGQEFVRYTYDAWGKLLSVDGTATNLCFYNPLRYRGYVYDEETGLYYLQSRYYNPEMGRFINGDNYPSTGQGLTGNNMFAYCGNNPVNRADPSGARWFSGFWNDFWNDAKNQLEKQKKKAASNPDITATIGGTLSGALFIAGSISGGVTADTKGNVGLSLNLNGGGGFPNISAGIFGSVNNAPTISDQAGLGTAVGASGGPWVIAAGCDYNILINQVNNCIYHGLTLTATYGIFPTIVEVHGEAGYTLVRGVNIFDVAISIADFMSK
jgi:RHS repeat-associated protein